MQFLFTTALAATALLGQATAYYFEKTCKDITLDATTDIISANCNDKQSVPHPNSLDLNGCLGYNVEDKAIGHVSTTPDVCHSE